MGVFVISLPGRNPSGRHAHRVRTRTGSLALAVILLEWAGDWRHSEDLTNRRGTIQPVRISPGRRRAEQRLGPLVESIAAGTGVQAPKIEVTIWAGPSAGPPRSGRYVMSFPRRLALRASALELHG